jgi:RNA polymerase sigma factor (sigma-70 family)
LLRLYRTGEQEAATQLYQRYVNRLRALVRAQCSNELARTLEPDDIVQSVFRRFFQRVSQGDYDVPQGQDLWSLFLVIALNKVRTAERHYRAGKRDVRLTLSGEAGAVLMDISRSDPEASDTLFDLTVREILERLPPQHRRMVELRIQGHDVAEIAAQTQRSKRTVERSLQEVRQRLSDLLAMDE